MQFMDSLGRIEHEEVRTGCIKTIISGGSLDSAMPCSPERRRQRSDGQRPSFWAVGISSL